MKIAFVVFTDFPERTAPARRVYLLGRGLAHRGHQVHVLVPQRFTPGPLEQLYDGLHVRWFEQIDWETSTRLSRRVKARWALVREVDRLARSGLDWLVTYNLGLDAVPMAWRVHSRNGCIAAMYDDLRAYPMQRRLEDFARRLWLEPADQWLPRQTQLNIAISTFLADRLQTVAPQTPRVVIPPLVDPDRFQFLPDRGATFRSQWGIPSDMPLVSYLGTYWHVEGITVLLRSLAEIAQKGTPFRATISGEAAIGLDCDDVPALIREMDLQERVILTGWLKTDDVIGAMSAADILVIPKLDHIANQAGVPTKLAEYLAMGRAVIASRVGDIPRYLRDGEDALLCNPGDAGSWTLALQRLLASADLRSHLGCGARDAALRHFHYVTASEQVELAMLTAAAGKTT